MDPNHMQQPPSSDKQQQQSGSAAPKMSFSLAGVRKKTPFEKRREEAERKKREAEEEAAKIYDDFVKSFEADDNDSNKKPGVAQAKAFVRGEVIVPLAQQKVQPSHKDAAATTGATSTATTSFTIMKPNTKDTLYKPAPLFSSKKPEDNKSAPTQPAAAAAAASSSAPSAPATAAEEKRPPLLGTSTQKKPRALDSFLEELKLKQSKGIIGQPTHAVTHRDDSGSAFDSKDPGTTNLYIGNVNPHVTEEILLREFGKFGPIGSVKIMWPRTEEERKRNRNSAFICFMNRKDAEVAKDAMQNVSIMGYEMNIGWGKAVPIPAVPIMTPDKVAELADAMDAKNRMGIIPQTPQIKVIMPTDPDALKAIHLLATYVARDGPAFESLIMERERENKAFQFLFDPHSSENTYYRWKVYSITHGDTEDKWCTTPFQMFPGGPIWIPPPCPAAQDENPYPISSGKSQQYPVSTGAGSGASAEKKAKKTELTDEEFEVFQNVLRTLTMERKSIKAAMGFALDNSEAAEEIVQIIADSLCINETPLPTKIARMYLLSDILHNSSAPVTNAFLYRTGFQQELPRIFESLNYAYRNVGRISGEAFKERILRILRVWEIWSVYPQPFLEQLEATFLKKPQ